jgi:hypothetical protein
MRQCLRSSATVDGGRVIGTTPMQPTAPPWIKAPAEVRALGLREGAPLLVERSDLLNGAVLLNAAALKLPRSEEVEARIPIN